MDSRPKEAVFVGAHIFFGATQDLLTTRFPESNITQTYE